jgi:hypothetical protein
MFGRNFSCEMPIENGRKKTPMQGNPRKVLGRKWAQYSPIFLMSFLKSRKIRLSAKLSRYDRVTAPPSTGVAHLRA